MKFTYSSGQRPLDGYTIKRGVGRGGFGEVYFAVSDGGKETALKLVRGESQIELRGVAQCINLKHPNLVSIFDMRTDAQGDHWVVMEYVAGEGLNVVLQRHPQGLPRELAREWFLGLARAVGYLHDHGVVHRDLKPANVFVENSQVKVGDYGLSKSLTASQRSANTQSVGTVHYMAPEISTGNYNKQIDVYAAGVIFYEMLTGRVPFDGESAGEILMKHLTTPPDLSKVPVEYLPIVAKALAKNPVQRYGSMADMARAVEAVHTASEPVSSRPPPPIPPLPPFRRADAAPTAPHRTPRIPPQPILTVLPAITLRDQITELCRSLSLTVLFAAVATMLWAAVGHTRDFNFLGTVFYLITAVSWSILIPSKFWTDRRGGDGWVRRLVLLLVGALIGLGALWLDGWGAQGPPQVHLIPTATTSVIAALAPGVPNEASYISYFGLAFFALRWWRMADRRRPHRFSFAPVLAAAFWGLVLLLVAERQLWYGIGVLMISSAVVQLVSPWEPPPPPPAKRMRLRYA